MGADSPTPEGADSPVTTPKLNLTQFSDVAKEFIKACNAFNTHKIETLEAMIDPDAVMYRIKSGNPIVERGPIVDYLRDKFSDDMPICALITTELFPPSLPTSVRGIALWGSAKDPTVSFRVQYEISFRRERPHLVTSFWARPC
jgi:hypothetical protein